MKNKKDIVIDLTKDNVMEQIENAHKKLTKKPWYKRVFNAIFK